MPYLSLAPATDRPHSRDTPPLHQSEAAELLHRHLHGNPAQLSDQGLREGRDRAVYLHGRIVPDRPGRDRTNVALRRSWR